MDLYPTLETGDEAWQSLCLTNIGNLYYAMAQYEEARTYLERALGLVVQTPGLHRVHHAPDRPRTDSNYGLVLTVWDRLLVTYRGRERSMLETRFCADFAPMRSRPASAAASRR